MEYQRAETGRKGGGGKMVKKRKNMNEELQIFWVTLHQGQFLFKYVMLLSEVEGKNKY